MISTLIGQKLNQAQDFLQNGKRVPVTEIVVTENVVLQVKSVDKDFYAAIQLGVGAKKKPTRALVGHAKKSGVNSVPSKIREVSVDGISEEDMPKSGDLISVDAVFKPGDIVEVSGISKGKGFAGGVKRHGFKGGPKTHGQSDRHRAPGSIGQGTTPGRVYKGKRMAGRMGSDTVTLKNLTVIDVDPENKKIYVTGLIPGHRNSWVYITRTGERKNFVPLLSSVEKEQAQAAKEVAKAAEEAPIEEKPNEEISNGKEVKSDVEIGEKKAPDSSEKEETLNEAEENVGEEKTKPANAVEKTEGTKVVDVGSSSELKEKEEKKDA